MYLLSLLVVDGTYLFVRKLLTTKISVGLEGHWVRQASTKFVRQSLYITVQGTLNILSKTEDKPSLRYRYLPSPNLKSGLVEEVSYLLNVCRQLNAETSNLLRSMSIADTQCLSPIHNNAER